ncbi:MAG: hypothetical protein E7115_04460 [Bacteroidales bacterium]|nr:hypothetical protein [Bacteroidales bacterium]
MSYRKIFKWLLVVLFITGLVTSVFGFLNEWPDTDEWKLHKKNAKDLPKLIEKAKEDGVRELTKAELNDKKNVVAVELAKKGNDATAKFNELQKEIDSKKGREKTRLAAKYKSEMDSLTTIAIAANDSLTIVKNEYAKEYELRTNIDKLNEAEAYIANGDASVDTILIGTYVMFAIAVLALFTVIFVITGMNSLKSLGKIIVWMIIIGLIVFIAWKIAPGDALHPDSFYKERGAAIPADGDLKMTDSILYLTYLLVGGTFIALIVSWVVGAIRK